MNYKCRHFQSRRLSHCQVLKYPRLVPQCARVQVCHDQRHLVTRLTTDHSPGDTGGQLRGRVTWRLGHETRALTVALNVFCQLSPASELIATLMTLIWRHACVSNLVLVQVALIGELFVAELAGEAEHLGVDRLFVLLEVFGISRHVSADVTSSFRRTLIQRNGLIIKIDTMNIQFM